MLECVVERSEDRRQCGHKKEKRATHRYRLARLTQETTVVRNVLQNVHRDNRISRERPVMVAEISLKRPHASVAEKAALEDGESVRRRLYRGELANSRHAQEEL